MTDMLARLQAAGRGWNSWASEWPAQMSQLPRGLALTPVAYASSKNAFTDFPAQGGGVHYGSRSVRGEQIALRLSHAGTEFDLSYSQPEADALRLSWSTVKLGEWGLRFWLCWTLRWQPDANEAAIEWRYDEKSGELSATHPRHGAVVLAEDAPALLATFHADPAALRAEFEQQGYFYLGSRGTRGAFPCLRYNFEEMPRLSLAIAFGATHDEASAKARRALAAAPETLPRLQTGQGSHALDAVRDVVGWNSVWDAINKRPYTSLSRAWVAQKFGGFGLWLDDIFYHAWMAALFDRDIAVENLEALISVAQPAGNLPCLMTGRDSWVDRSQPPIGSLATWMIAAHSGDPTIVDLAYDTLLANHDWWFHLRDGNGDGLMGWGTSPGVGAGLYRGTKLGARDESSMDNSPIHDEADLDRASGMLTAADVGLNSLLVLDAEILSHWAEQRGDQATALAPASTRQRFGSQGARPLVGRRAQGVRQSLVERPLRALDRADQLLSAAGGHRDAGADPAPAALARRSAQVRRLLAPAVGDARRSRLSRQRLLARADLAAAQPLDLSRPAPSRPERGGGTAGLRQLPPVRAGLAQGPVPGEFQCRERPRR